MTAHPVTQYARDVVAGKIIAGKWVRLACQRHLDDLVDGLARGLVFNEDYADHAIAFYPNYCVHSKGEWAGSAIELEAWQQFCVGSVFGWVVAATALRRFATAYNEVARKNGKTTMAAGTGVYMEVADGEPGAEVYSVATKREQAKICFDEAARMVRKSPELSSRIRVMARALVCDDDEATFQPLASEANTLDGLNPHAAIIDELHAHKSRDAFDVIESGTGARRQPLMWVITTAGESLDTVCGEQREYSEKVLEGVIADDSWFAYIAAIDDGDDWGDPAVWIKANPNLGVSVYTDQLTRRAAKAKASPASQANFKQKSVNIWGEHGGKWIDIKLWNAAASDFDPALFAGRRAYAGLDVSSKIDLTASAYAFEPDPDHLDPDQWHLVVDFFFPEGNLAEATQRDRVPYDQWAEAGWLTLTGGNMIDQEFIRNSINERGELFVVPEVVVDPWNTSQLATWLDGDGFEVVDLRQGFKSMSEPTKFFEGLVLSSAINHGNNPVLRYNASNVTVRGDANENFIPDKKKSNRRIDGIVASILAISRSPLCVTEPDEGTAWGEDREVAVA